MGFWINHFCIAIQKCTGVTELADVNVLKKLRHIFEAHHFHTPGDKMYLQAISEILVAG